MKRKELYTNISNLLDVANHQQEAINLLLMNYDDSEINSIERKNAMPAFEDTSEELEYQKERAKSQNDQILLEVIVLKKRILEMEKQFQDSIKAEKEKRKQCEQNCKKIIALVEAKVKKQSIKQKELREQQVKMEKVFLKLARFVLASTEIDSLKEVEREIKIAKKYNIITVCDKERMKL